MSFLKSNFDSFDAIYCINLDRRTDRWEKVQKEFAKVGIQDKVMRFGAIETPENGHIGCMLSHRAIIQKAKNEGWKNVLVFEDDICFDSGYTFIFDSKISPILPEILYLSGTFTHPRLRITSYNDHYWQVHSGLYGAMAICYFQAVYSQMLDILGHSLPFDKCLAQVVQRERLCLLLKSSPVQFFGVTYSDTDDVTKGRFFSYINHIGYWTATRGWIPYISRFLLMGFLTRLNDINQQLCKKYRKFFIKSGLAQSFQKNSKNTK